MKAALFDMDGVICDTQIYHESIYRDLAKEQYNTVLDKEISQQLKGVLKNEGAKVFCQAVGLEATEENMKKVYKQKNERYQKIIKEKGKTLLIDGAEDLIIKLKKNNVLLALASASSNASYIIEMLGLKNYFDYIVDVSKIKRGKPNPAIFLDAAINLGVDPADCVVYEDAENGIIAAKKAGMYAIGYNVDLDISKLSYSVYGADRVVTSLRDPLCYEGLYTNLPSQVEECELFIFDAGGVILKNINCFAGIFKQYNFSKTQIREFINDYINYDNPMMENMITPEQYWKHIEKNFGIKVEGNPFYDYFKPYLNDEMIDTINKLKANGKKVVLGSNTFAPHLKVMKDLGLYDLLDNIYASCEIQRYKPCPSFFRYILNSEKVDANKAMFIDDLDLNIAAAATVGLKTLHYNGENKSKLLKQTFSFLN